MNQNNYAILGAMAGFIFTDNREGYNERVEWFTVNKTARDQGFNGSVKQLFRLIDTNAATGEKLDKPVVQHVEMGRDQAHGSGDLTNAAVISRMLLAQGTKVDPVDGTVSDKANAVGPYEFLGDRILAAANYFWQYMLGYDTPWVPVPYAISPDGTVRGIYQKLSDSYRGRSTTALFWDMYYYYTYVRGVNVAEKAPYFYEAFTKRTPSNYYYKGALAQAWESVDGGGDWWIYIPQAAESEGTRYLPKEQPDPALVQVEERYTAFDGNTLIVNEGNTSFVQFRATAQGGKIAVQNLSYADRTNSRLIGLKFRTNGPAVLELSKDFQSAPYHTLTLPDTKGQWTYITYDMGIGRVSYGQLDGDYSLLYMNVRGNGATVDIDHLNVQAGTALTPPVFQAGPADMNTVAYVGAPVTLDFSATDSKSTDVLAYEMQNGPVGAQLNAATGAFSWQPAQAGTYSFIVQASDGTTVAAKKVNLVVTADRTSAVQAAVVPYDPGSSYVTASLNHFQAVYNDTMGQIQTATDAEFYRQLSSLRSAAEALQLLTPLLPDGSMDYAKIATSTFGSAISLLADGNNNTFAAYTLAPNLYHVLDFGLDYKISADAFAMQGRMNFTDRMAGSAVFGSNDGVNWTRLTPGETPFTDDMAVLAVDDAYKNAQFRYIKIQMLHPQPDVLHNTVNNMLELGEFRIYGKRYETGNKLQSISIGSDQSVGGRIALGSSVTLTIKAKEAIRNVKVKIQGQDAAVTTSDNINWTAVAAMNQGVSTGAVYFSIDYQRNDGTNGDTAFSTTDNSKLFLADESDLIGDVTGIAALIDSTAGRTAAETLKQTNYLFDGNPNTNSDYRLNGSGAGSYITFDFKEGNEVALSSVELLARQDQGLYSRLKGAVVQGSNDNATWTTLTNAAAATPDWQSLAVGGTASYRYIRIYNSNSWFGNMTELRLHGVVKGADRTPPVTTDDAPQGWVNRDTTVTFKAADAESGVAATYFKVDGGPQQIGSSVTLTAEDEHTLEYWSVDKEGNTEQAHTVAVNIDKTAPAITVSGLVYGAYSDSVDITPLVTIHDSMSGVDGSKTTVTLDTYGLRQGTTIPLYTLPLGLHTFTVTAADQAGNSGSVTVTFQTTASIPSLQDLVIRFTDAGWIDNEGIANSLQSKLKANDLTAFVNFVKAQSGKHISSTAADYLLRDARYLLSKQ
ncbi:OmpL47-type beta-barrel domain-containing protein [Paenibacillus hamazuiensis]|uniref:OmpL47-type beta-barrel domain-containing protein n=1 Tax=Paenibacillus hamazuiensis TaxID=2936508 RepID=UPI00200C8561|nr:discoidin domain-containing protein [Paenibacillus hamazuiensis]